MSTKNRLSFVMMTITGSLLAACTTVQAPAPIEQGNAAYGAQADAYGIPAQTSAPYVPQSARQAYTPPQQSYPQSYSATSYQAAPLNPVNNGDYVPSYAPVDVNANTHTVIYGDTVYNIAKRYGINQNDLRTWNQLSGNTISIGQVLRVKPSAGYPSSAPAPYTAPAPTTAPAPAPSNVRVVPPSATAPQTASVPVPQASAPAKDTSGIQWQKPTQGQILTGFGGNSKGIDYGGQVGQPVYAAASGKVVYSGSGLRGYGRLLIIQHNSRYLTAYGNNQKLLVKEGQSVKRGQKIAQMGSSDASRVQLHFEVREDGKPVDPSRFIK